MASTTTSYDLLRAMEGEFGDDLPDPSALTATDRMRLLQRAAELREEDKYANEDDD